jgi:flagellar biosynthesis/type III secretory pathway protein FliH
MTTIARANRILRYNYVPGAALVSVPAWNPEPEEPEIILPTPEEIEAEIAARVEVARRESFEDGFKRGMVEGRKAVEPEFGRIRTIVAQIESQMEQAWREIEHGAAHLGMEIGRKVVGAAVETHEQVAIELARRGAGMAREQTQLKILVSPADVEALRAVQVDIIRAADGVHGIEIDARESIAPGGVIIECEVGRFDLRPEVQMEAIERVLEVEPG